MHVNREESTVNKGDFVGSMPVQLIGSKQVMTLGGTPDDWICTYVENGHTVTVHVEPAQVEPALP
jgi:hypothetical protein